MERKDFLQGIGIFGAGVLVPRSLKASSNKEMDEAPFACTLTPTETAGPYPYPGTVPTTYTSSPLYRSNIIGDLPTAGGGGAISGGTTAGGGIVLSLTLTLQNLSCTPISNARVDIWHCDKRGIYSAYSSTQNGGDWTAYTFLRGIQTTDSNGQVTFTTIFPSWYIPRAIHFHVQVYINNTLYSTTQLGVLDSLGVTINNSTGYNRAYTYTNATDQVFSDGFSNQLLTVTGSNTAGYNATGLVVVDYTVLPLDLLSFTAFVESKDAVLKWTTTSEVNVAKYEVERSYTGSSFTTIGSVNAANGAGTNNYSFTNTPSSSITYYRLKMIDKDGSYTYSSIIAVNSAVFTGVSVYPNPAKDKIVITHAKTDEATWVRVMDVSGAVVAQSKLPASITSTSFDVSAFKAGTYILSIESKTEKASIKFTKL